MNISQHRIGVIDTARGLAIILMVVGHLGMKNGIVQFVYSFHMPLFFVISGLTYTFHEDYTLLSYAKNKFKRLLVPYYLFALIYANPSVKNYLYVFVGSRFGLLESGSRTPLWFLPCLFTANLLFHIMVVVCKKLKINVNYVLLFGVVSCFWGIAINHSLNDISRLPYGIGLSLIVMPFICFGWWIKNFFLRMKTHGSLFPKLIICISSCFLLLVLYRFNLPNSLTEGFCHVELSIGQCGNYYLFYINALLGSLLVMFLSFFLDNEFLQLTGMSTLACLGSHTIIISTVGAICSRMFFPDWSSYLLCLIAVLVVTIPLQKLLETLVPNIVGKF